MQSLWLALVSTAFSWSIALLVRKDALVGAFHIRPPLHVVSTTFANNWRRETLPAIRGTMAAREGVESLANERSPPLPSIIKGILFDMDGTLTDSDTLHFEAYRETLLTVRALRFESRGASTGS